MSQNDATYDSLQTGGSGCQGSGHTMVKSNGVVVVVAVVVVSVVAVTVVVVVEVVQMPHRSGHLRWTDN